MKTAAKIILCGSVMTLAFVSLSWAFPDTDKASIGITGTPVAVAVSPDDRWVFVASNDSGTGTVYLVDTITWQVTASKSLSIGSSAVDMDVSNDGSRLYVTDSKGYLTQINLASLSTFQLGSTLTLTSKRCLADTGLNPLGKVFVGPKISSSTYQYVIVNLPDATSPSVKIFSHTGMATTLDGGNCPLANSVDTSAYGIPIGLTAAFDKFSTGGSGCCSGHTGVQGCNMSTGRINCIDGFSSSCECDFEAHVSVDSSSAVPDSHGWINISSGTPPSSALVGSASAYKLSDIAINTTADKVFIAATIDRTEKLLSQDYISADVWDPSSSITVFPQSTTTREISMNLKEMLYFVGYDPDTAGSALNFYYPSDLSVPALTTDNIQFPNERLTDVNSSSVSDGYVYLAGVDATAGELKIISDNPWLDLTTYPSIIDTGSAATVSFHTDELGKLEVYRGGGIKKTGTLIYTKDITTNDDSFDIDPSWVTEGDNTIILFVTDADGNTGRIGFPLTKASSPLFNLDFGDQTIFVTINVPNDSKIDYYMIYYSSDPNVINTIPISSDVALTGTVSPNTTVKKTIAPVTNDVLYYVRIQAVYSSGGSGPLSEVKTVLPQATLTLSELKGESGGCTVVATGGAALGAAFWIIIAFPVFYSMLRRRKWAGTRRTFR